MKAVKVISIIFGLLISVSPLGAQEIHNAVRHRDIEKIKGLLSEDPLRVNAEDNNGRTPLMISVMAGNKEIVDLLLKSGARVKIIDNGGRSPLHFAVARKHIEIVRLLIEKGAVVDARPLGLSTPLKWASDGGALKIAEYLISEGADIEAKCSASQTPLFRSVYRNDIEFLEMLLSQGAEVNHEDFLGRTPLQIAVSMGYSEIVKILLDNGADLEVKDREFSRTLHHLAAIHGHQEIIGILLEYGLNLNLRDKKNRAALDYAYKYGHNTLADYIYARGAESSEPKEIYVKHLSEIRELGDGEAIICKLCGNTWGIKTKNHFLVFGYSESGEKPAEPSLANGYITLEALNGQKIFAGFNNSSSLYKMRKDFKDITFIFNPISGRVNQENVIYPQLKKNSKVDSIEIFAVPAWNRNRGYYIIVDKLSVFLLPIISNPYNYADRNTEGIDYLVANNLNVDILFFGTTENMVGTEMECAYKETFYASDKLEAKAVFPMGSDAFTRKFARRIARKKSKPDIYCAENPGDRYCFQNGRIKQIFTIPQ